MRQVSYLSPTSIGLWLQDPALYYRRYLSDARMPREPQTPAMAVGSGFDAHIKSRLHNAVFKNDDPRFKLDAILESQVEPQNIKIAKEAGARCLEWYERLGALASLVLSLGKCVGKPRMELDVRGIISFGRDREVKGIPFHGKPDLFFVSEQGAHVVLDWKVNGYFSQASPLPGYVALRQDGKLASPHGDARVEVRKGMLIDASKPFEHRSEEWARQLCIYSWLCGEEVGDEFIAQVHQIICRPSGIRVAEHSALVSKEFQELTFTQAAEIWDCIQSGWIFKNLSRQDSDARCGLLNTVVEEDDPLAR